ncbi:hypothetical protein BDZ91DRAFT_720120 [Kalaharituber pfeilii]|nr:hypothetical protein BDZ91DRAFT_720120 [Kalaharituber pfeilii]
MRPIAGHHDTPRTHIASTPYTSIDTHFLANPLTMLRLFTSKPLIGLRPSLLPAAACLYSQAPACPSNARLDRSDTMPSPTASSTLTGGDRSSSDTGPSGGSTPHTTEKDRGLDVQSDSAHRGMEEHAQAQRDAAKIAEQAGGSGRKVSWNDEFPKKPPGPVIGMQDQTGGVAQRGGISPGEGRKGTVSQVESDRG